MDYMIAFLIFSLCFIAMALGVIISKKALQKGCAVDPDSCACRREGKDPSECDQPQ